MKTDTYKRGLEKDAELIKLKGEKEKEREKDMNPRNPNFMGGFNNISEMHSDSLVSSNVQLWTKYLGDNNGFFLINCHLMILHKFFR